MPKQLLETTLAFTSVVVVLSSLALTGCHARQLGATVSDTRAAHVDRTWVAAARSCWPGLRSETDGIVSASLLDPIGFRGAFAVYGTYSDREIEQIVAGTVFDAPPPENASLANAATPLITRQQAVYSVATPDPHASQIVTPDTLCAVHSGMPVGFR